MKSIRTWSRPAQYGLLAATVLILCIVLLILAEITIRARQWYRYGNFARIEDTYVLDPASGLRIPKPRATVGPIHINSLGFRGPEFVVPKPDSSVRIAFLGSSTTFCGEVSSDEMAWPALVTKELQAKWPQTTIDYVNAGVPGYTVSSSLRNLEKRVSRLAPDVIVIYEGHNDLTGNALDLAVAQGLVKGPTEKDISWPAKYSLFWYLIEKNLMIRSLQRTAMQSKGKLSVGSTDLSAPFRRDLTQLVTASQQVADIVVLATFSTQLRREQSPEQQSRAAESSLYYMPYMSIPTMLDGYESYNKAVRTVAEETGAFLVDGEYLIPGDEQHFNDTVHFKDAGSQAMAKRVVDALIQAKRFQQLLNRGQ